MQFLLLARVSCETRSPRTLSRRCGQTGCSLRGLLEAHFVVGRMQPTWCIFLILLRASARAATLTGHGVQTRVRLFYVPHAAVQALCKPWRL